MDAWRAKINRSSDADEQVERELHRTIKQVTEQVPSLQYNTAIAAMMEYLNVVRQGGRTARRAELEPLLILLAPFAPHIAEELHARLGHDFGLFESARWPSFDESKTVDAFVEIAVQVNGKLRGQVDVPAEADEATVHAAAEANEKVAKYLSDQQVVKVIYVPDKLINLVVKQG